MRATLFGYGNILLLASNLPQWRPVRNSEVIRQWNLLRALEAARHGVTVTQLSRELEVTTRTIWRDMEALQAVGFPLFNEKEDRETRWKLNAVPFKGLADRPRSNMRTRRRSWR